MIILSEIGIFSIAEYIFIKELHLSILLELADSEMACISNSVISAKILGKISSTCFSVINNFFLFEFRAASSKAISPVANS